LNKLHKINERRRISYNDPKNIELRNKHIENVKNNIKSLSPENRDIIKDKKKENYKKRKLDKVTNLSDTLCDKPLKKCSKLASAINTSTISTLSAIWDIENPCKL
jgi:hypothetical protein